MKKFRDLNLGVKIGGGFGLIIIILLIIVALANNNLGMLDDNANIVNTADLLNENAVRVRLYVRDYILNSSEEIIEDKDKLIAQMNARIENGRDEFSDRERFQELMGQSENLLETYDNEISNLVEITNRREEIRDFYSEQELLLIEVTDNFIDRRTTAINRAITQNRPQLEVELENDLGRQSNQLRRMIDELTRLSRDYIIYLDDYERRMDLFSQIEESIAEASSLVEELESQIIFMGDLNALGEITEALDQVEMAFADLVELENEADEVEENLLTAGDQFIGYMEEVENVYQAEFDQVRAGFQRSLLISAIIALIIAIITSVFVTKSITGPVSKLVEIAIAGKDGDLTKDIMIDQDDEIGVLASSFQQMINNLRNMIQQIQRVSENLASSSEEMSASSEEMSASANEIGRAIEEVASGSQEQSAQVDETRTNVNGLSEEIDQISNMSAKMDQESEQVVDNINKGNQAVQESIEQVKKVRNRSDNVTESINELGELSSKIGDIIEIINGIAAQTNLLALNAAIEAARAGEAGRGFSVVADEIRELAEESSQSTEEIGRLITEIQNGVNDAIKEMDSTNSAVGNSVESIQVTEQSFEEIRKVAISLEDLIENIAVKTDEMALSSNNVNKAIEEVAAISDQASANAQQVAASSEEQAASTQEVVGAAQELAEMAEELAATVDRFKIK